MKYRELPDAVCETLLIELLQSIPELLQKVAPEGFACSPLVSVFHPAPEQMYKEYCRMIENMTALLKAAKKEPTHDSTMSFEDFKNDMQPEPIEERCEMVSIMGNCIWKIFSNNHTVLNANGESYHLGSWRGSGGFIADVINKLQLVTDKSFDYMDFYMGGIFFEKRADLIPIYEFIFKKLKADHLDWEYSFPRMGMVNLKNNDEEQKAPEDYDAHEAVQKQIEKAERQKEMDDLQERLDKMYAEEYEDARYEKPSAEVAAYFNVYGHYPTGHPLAEG